MGFFDDMLDDNARNHLTWNKIPNFYIPVFLNPEGKTVYRLNRRGDPSPMKHLTHASAAGDIAAARIGAYVGRGGRPLRPNSIIRVYLK